jgi:hypothetical protein
MSNVWYGPMAAMSSPVDSITSMVAVAIVALPLLIGASLLTGNQTIVLV